MKYKTPEIGKTICITCGGRKLKGKVTASVPNTGFMLNGSVYLDSEWGKSWDFSNMAPLENK